MFNWLQYDVPGSRCLDLFSGSGALGFEAASRGAKQVVFVENNPQTCQNLQLNIAALQASQIELSQMDVRMFLNNGEERFDLVFLDPPFAQNLLQPTCMLLAQSGKLAASAKIYLEAERGLLLNDLPENWHVLKHKQAGDVSFNLYQIG